MKNAVPLSLVVLALVSAEAAGRQLQQQCAVDVASDVDYSGNDCCGGVLKVNSSEDCCAACSKKMSAGCRFWTYASGLKHCYLKHSDSGRRKSAGHSSGAVAGPPSPSRSCPQVPEPSAPHPPLPTGQYRFPYSNPFIIHDIGDGCPDINVDDFKNDADVCPAQWRLNCTAKGGDENPLYCGCGTPQTGHGQKNCHECSGQPNKLLRKPANVTAYKSNDLCHRYPPITRRQIIERALGWVSNGWLYGRYKSPGWTPETCGSEDEAECPQYSYESVCNGLLEMSWKSDDTNVGPGKRKSWPPTKIDCLDVRPGDWLHIGHHMQMFRRWINGSGIGKPFVLYQMGGGWGKANAVVSTFSSRYGPCYQRPNIINDEQETASGKFCSTGH